VTTRPHQACGDTIGVLVQGVALNLHCPHTPLRDYAKGMLRGQVRAPWPRPDLDVSAIWSTPASDDDAARPVFDVTGLESFGKRMHVGPDQVVWTDTHRDRHLQLRFRRQGSQAGFDVAYQFRPSAKKLAKWSDYEHKKYFDLLRYLVWFPIAWHLRRTRGLGLIHAAAASNGHGAVLIAGPGGAGKTTTGLALAARGMTLLSENLALTDGHHVYPVAEPIRLTDESLRLLGDAASTLEPLAAADCLEKKTMFAAPAGPEPLPVRAAALFLARFSPRGAVRPLPPAAAYDLVRATNTLTLELNDFDWYAAGLDLLWPGEQHAGEDPLRRLTRDTPCFVLAIDRAAGVSAVVDQIQDCMRGLEPVLARRAP
jgi:hypothetical protein